VQEQQQQPGNNNSFLSLPMVELTLNHGQKKHLFVITRSVETNIPKPKQKQALFVLF
jgi:hypothetical protein